MGGCGDCCGFGFDGFGYWDDSMERAMAMAMHLHKYEIYQRSKLKWMLIGLIWLFRDLAGSLWRMLMPHHNKHKHTHTHTREHSWLKQRQF